MSTWKFGTCLDRARHFASAVPYFPDYKPRLFFKNFRVAAYIPVRLMCGRFQKNHALYTARYGVPGSALDHDQLRVMITNVLPRFLWITVYSSLNCCMETEGFVKVTGSHITYTVRVIMSLKQGETKMLLIQTAGMKWYVTYQMAPFSMTFSNLLGHSPDAYLTSAIFFVVLRNIWQDFDRQSVA